ncbi:uncharacterized protein KIAA1522 homolog isoform X2 [Polypterus senegalus]|uniref:uncharacterized protein KIAA1522 homolog isoform X2 n=1 Tax=Polypterus senegalus TaxID=55291 RepID=UPI0019658856|nr:uncharacterized protein KIAA1522 homolog isoform X2 [Polypterus senegalus]
MGNAHHKKAPRNGKPKSFWHFGRAEKVKAANPKPDDESQLTVHYTAGQSYQENVFIPGNRPQYLENLHSEAQEGLKSLQQQENETLNENGLDCTDSQSLSSARTLQPEDETFQNRTSDNHLADPPDTRSQLTRTGSTFKPLTVTPKKEKKGQKKSRRTTITGIPQHIQKELGLERNQIDKTHGVGIGAEDTNDIIIAPTIDGAPQQEKPQGVRVHLQAIEAMDLVKEEETEQILHRHITKVYLDDSVLNHKVCPRLSPLQRPKSLAVPGMTTNSCINEPHSPVMSISPQATYLSKIIPNAILPFSVDIIEISRSKSRSSVRTVSKSSLVTASPALSHSSIRFNTQGLNLNESSSASDWSHSQSSETIVSNNSTISSQGSKNYGEEAHPQEKTVEKLTPDQMSLNSCSSWVTASSNVAPEGNSLLTVTQSECGRSSSPCVSMESAVEDSDTISIKSDKSFSRNLSVTKMKKPPTPPRRTYSLHQAANGKAEENLVSMAENGSDPDQLANKDSLTKYGGQQSQSEEEDVFSPVLLSETNSIDLKMGASSPPDNSVDNSATTSHLTTEQVENRNNLFSLKSKFERTMSPSSGYSSQSGTPTLPSKGICYPPSPVSKKAKPLKPDRINSCTSPATSVSSSLTSLSSSISEPVQKEQTPTVSSPTAQPSKNTLITLPKPFIPVGKVNDSKVSSRKDLFFIPPHPKVQAPHPPPPEVRMKNKRTAEIPSKMSRSGDAKDQPKEPLEVPKEKAAGPVAQQETRLSVNHIAPPPQNDAPSSPSPSPPPSHQPPPPPSKNNSVSSDSSCPLTALETILDHPASENMWSLPPPPPPEEHISTFASEDELDFSFPPPPPPVATEAAQPQPVVNTSDAYLNAESLPRDMLTCTLPTVNTAKEASAVNAEPSECPAATSDNLLPVSSQLKSTTQLKETLDVSSSEVSHFVPHKPAETPQNMPQAPSLITLKNQGHTSDKPVFIKKQASPSYQEITTKEALARTKSAPDHKEDPSIPLVTPSLLQMVRLRSVNVGSPSQMDYPATVVQESKQVPVNGASSNQNIPPKPIRKSLSLKSPPAVKESSPSLKLQEAIRMKTAAMSSKGPSLPKTIVPMSTTGPCFSPSSNNDKGLISPLSPDDGIAKSPASTASFIFSKSTKKVVFETPTSPESQTELKRNLVAELMSISNSSKATGSQQIANSKPALQKKPPPVAKKPAYLPTCTLTQPKTPSPTTTGEVLSPGHDNSSHTDVKVESRSSMELDSACASQWKQETAQLAGQQAQAVQKNTSTSNQKIGTAETPTP